MKITIEALNTRKTQLQREINVLNAQLSDKERELNEIGCKIDILLNRQRCKLCDCYIGEKAKQISVITTDSETKTSSLRHFKVCKKCFYGLLME